ncbi:recombination protein RecR [Rickettsiales bacterium]|nr:recombination protein RecR [Rickettsiales bacterium]
MDSDIENLVALLSKLPGVGPRSAKRIVLRMLQFREGLMLPLAEAIEAAARSVKYCEICHNLDSRSPCRICVGASRDRLTLCVVENVIDVWAFERSRAYRGLYHVLGGNLSTSNSPEELRIHGLLARAKEGGVKEVIIATNATVEGQTTAHYIAECLRGTKIKISRLAHGVPIGGELDYLDDSTLGIAMDSRTAI